MESRKCHGGDGPCRTIWFSQLCAHTTLIKIKTKLKTISEKDLKDCGCNSVVQHLFSMCWMVLGGGGCSWLMLVCALPAKEFYCICGSEFQLRSEICTPGWQKLVDRGNSTCRGTETSKSKTHQGVPSAEFKGMRIDRQNQKLEVRWASFCRPCGPC
jgi:hypothetical protein